MTALGVNPGRPRRSLRWIAALLVCLPPGLLVSLRPVDPALLHPRSYESFHLYDRYGRPLGESLTAEETSSAWVPLEAMSPDLPAAAVAAEDRRFYSHHGLDFLAIAHAALTDLRARKIVRGASTITQQLARMILADEARAQGAPAPSRSFLQKAEEAWLALRLERSFSKRDILEAWLNRVPVGGVARGIPSGALRYFGVHPSRLSLDQAALLVGLPRGPTVLQPQRLPVAARKRRDHVLQSMEAAGIASPDRVAQAITAPISVQSPQTQPLRARLGAWVASELTSRGRPVSGAVTSTIDAHLEDRIAQILQDRIAPLRARGVKSGAVVVIDHQTDELLALVGSADEADPRWGQVHAAFALRQPGSALKPFVYLTALEHGKTLASLAADMEQAFPDMHGAYLPQNYDEQFHGPVRYRDALAQSLNIAAVDVLRSVGVRAVADTLQAAGITTMSREPEHYGLGLTLGSLDVELLELTEAYAVLARGGEKRPTRILLGDPPAGPGAQVFDSKATFLIASVLSDPLARAPQFGMMSVLTTPYWTAVKTGTSKGFRDNLCMGFSERYTVGVWVGDPEGHPMQHVSGVAGAGPIWRDVMDLLHRDLPSRAPPPPAGIIKAKVCPLSGLRAGPHCPGTREEWFVSGTEPAEECAMHQHLALAKKDGLPVPPGCRTPAGEPHDLVVWPSPYDAWAVPRGKGVPQAWTAACPAPPETLRTTPRILSPAQRETVRIDPERPLQSQQLLLLADTGGSRTALEFLVDGEPVTDSLGPDSALWTIRPGEHRIVARRPSGESSEPHLVTVK
jgi:penicillin-binding protein 1C